jgi:hypothetical protein
MLRFNLNNFIHTAIEKLFVNILSTFREDPSLKIALLAKTELPRHIVEGMHKARANAGNGSLFISVLFVRYFLWLCQL